MESLPLDIRGRGRLRARAEIMPDRVVIRLDDDANSAFWAEIPLSSWDLSILAQAQELAEDQPGVIAGVFGTGQVAESATSDDGEGELVPY